ncbi:hypothetical protein EI94DRAFT_1708412 [Lactarius quietus]|nr:hypothetical protein EI94DRAFT_1708412 [Lactarius quietus]
MPKKPVEELTKDELKLLVCMENLPSLHQQWYWDDNICEELMMGTQWGTTEKAGTPPDWTGLTLEVVTQSCDLQASKAPTWHQDLFALDLMPYLQDIPPKKQWWNFPPPPTTPDEDVNMEESPRDASPAPPSPPIPPASQKHTVKGKAWAVPPPLPPDEYGPPQTHHTRARKRSTVLPDLDGPADMSSEGEVDKDTPTHPVLPQGLLHVDVEGPSPSVLPRPLARIHELANTHALDEPLEYQGIPEHLESLKHKITQLKWLLLAICSKLGVDASSDTRSFDEEDIFGHDSGIDTISLTIPPGHPARPEMAINEYDLCAYNINHGILSHGQSRMQHLMLNVTGWT